MQGAIAASTYAASFVFSKGVAIFPGNLSPTVFPEAVASKKFVYLIVALLEGFSVGCSKPHSCIT